MKHQKNKKIVANKVSTILNKVYPNNATLLLWWNDPYKLLIAVIMSAQTTDASVNKVTPILWSKYPSCLSLSRANITEVEEIIKSIGFYKNKAKNVINTSKILSEVYDSQIPKNLSELIKLPGVGRKTANVVLSTAFNITSGIAVDTHVFRITHRLGLACSKTADKTERELLEIFPKKTWQNINNQMVRFGRQYCTAFDPKCYMCPLKDLCDFN